MKPLAALALLLVGGVALFFYLDSTEGGRGENGGRGGFRDPGDPVVNAPTTPATERDSGTTPAETRIATPEQDRQTAVVAQAPTRESHRFFGKLLGEREPLAGALLRLVSDGEEVASVRSDERGVFELTCGIPRQDLWLEVVGRGFVTLSRQLGPIERGGTKMLGNIRMLPGTLLRGTVVDEGGRPIAGARIKASPAQRGIYVLSVEGQADEKGAFELRDAPRGRIAITATAQGFGEQTVYENHDDASPVVIRLAKGRSLVLRLHDGRGAPVADALVQLSSNDPNASPRESQSDAEGRCVFDGLGAELWNVRVSKEHHRPAGRGQVLANGSEVEIEVPPWAAIEGKVLGHDGSPAPGGTLVRALPEGAPGDRSLRQAPGFPVADDGKFRIPGLRPGSWVVHITAPGHSPYASQPIRLDLTHDEYLGSLRLQPSARIAVRVLGPEGPLPQAQLEIATQAPRPARLFAPLPGAARPTLYPVRADGTLTLENVAAGEFWIVVRADGHTPGIEGPFRLQPGKTLGPEEVRLVPAAKITGKVKLDGPVAPGTWVRISEHEPWIGFPLKLPPDSQGKFESAWIPAGKYDLELLLPGQGARDLPKTEVTLEPGATEFVELEG